MRNFGFPVFASMLITLLARGLVGLLGELLELACAIPATLEELLGRVFHIPREVLEVVAVLRGDLFGEADIVTLDALHPDNSTSLSSCRMLLYCCLAFVTLAPEASE